MTNPSQTQQPIRDARSLGVPRMLILGLQHMFAMFGATVLVPILVNGYFHGEGLSVQVTLFFAGIGTLFFHICTKMKVPAFLGSSFAFLGGTFVGLDILDDGIKKIGRFVPNYWYSMSIKTIFGPEDYKKSLGYISVIFAFALACLGLSLIVSKINMEKKN